MDNTIIKLFIKHKKIFIYIFMVWFFFYLAIVSIAKEFVWTFPPSLSLGNLGLFGDSFNVLTSLFTGLAFAGVIVSVILQTQELKETREEFKGQKEALELQQKEMVNQSFDNKFFKMLDLLNSIIEFLTYTGSTAIIPNKGSYESRTYTSTNKEVFTDLKKQLEKKMSNITTDYDFFTTFKNFNDTYDLNFKYYFINLYQILKYIDEQYQYDYKKAKDYTNILRAQLPKDALVLLFYNGYGVTGFTDNKYKILLEKYAFFEHLRFEDINPEKYKIVWFLLHAYDEKIFGKNENMVMRINENNS